MPATVADGEEGASLAWQESGKRLGTSQAAHRIVRRITGRIRPAGDLAKSPKEGKRGCARIGASSLGVLEFGRL